MLKIAPPWAWVVLCVFGALTLVGLLFSVFGRVEVTERGRGILRPRGGVRLLQAQSAGMVVEVLAPTGARVRVGDPILRLELPQIRGAAMEADQRLRSLLEEFHPVAQDQARLFEQQVQTLRAQLQQLDADIASFQRSVARAEKRLAMSAELRKQGIISDLEHQNYEEQVDAARRQLAAGIQGRQQARKDLVAQEAQRAQQLWLEKSETDQARIQKTTAGANLGQALITAPTDGTVDALVLRPGDQVQVAQLVAKVIPRDTPLMAIAFLAEKDRAFVREGDRVVLELSQYTFSEFGTLGGRISRVGVDIASTSEVQEAFGAAANSQDPPGFRVEIELEPMTRGSASRMILRPGMLLNARFTLRRQSLITFAIEPLKRWLD